MHTKATYFSPRFAGFQLGASLTPDTGIVSGTGGCDTDNDGDFENVISYGVNYVGKFDEIGVRLPLRGQTATTKTHLVAQHVEDLSIWALAARLTLLASRLALTYNDFGETGYHHCER